MDLQVEGLIRLMEGEHVGPFNLGNPGEFTMLELAEVSVVYLEFGFYVLLHGLPTCACCEAASVESTHSISALHWYFLILRQLLFAYYLTSGGCKITPHSFDCKF